MTTSRPHPAPSSRHDAPAPRSSPDAVDDPHRRVRALADAVPDTDASAAARARERHATLAKPPGSLGRLEDVAQRLAAVTGSCPPPVPSRPHLLVAASDHGVHARGVGPWPQELTATVAAAVADGTAASGPIAATVGAVVEVVDVGVATWLAPHPRVRPARVRAGTDDLASGPAMTQAEAADAIEVGARAATEAIDGGADLLLLGEVGIANTTPSAALVAAWTGAPPAEVTGPGAGSAGAHLEAKVAAVSEGLRRHGPDRDPLGVLASLGGLEHAALVGVLLAAAARRVPVLLDGVTTLAAALTGVRLAPPLTGHLIAAHRSPEPAAGLALDTLGLAPLLDLGLRLGEGTGALLAVPLVQAAARVLRDTITLEGLVAGGAS